MRATSPATQAALEERKLVPRDFIWFIVKERATGNPVTDGMHSGVGQIQADVIDPETGAVVTRTWHGSGTLVAIDDIPLVSNLSVQTVSVQVSQLNDRVNDLVRLYEPKQGIVQIFRGLFDPETNVQISPAEPRFVGFIDEVNIQTPSENTLGSMEIICNSHTQELLRANSEYRSSESQKLRNPVDTFYDDAATVGDWIMFWGKASGKVPSRKIELPEFFKDSFGPYKVN